MVNNWDRITGKLYPKQAMALRNMIPDQASLRALMAYCAELENSAECIPTSLFATAEVHHNSGY